MTGVWWVATAMVAPAIALLYDHILTTDLEVQYIWWRPKRKSVYWFFFLRYLVSIGEIVTLALRFYTPPNPNLNDLRRCNIYQTFINIYTLIVELLVPWLMAVRVYAMYGRNRRILWTLWIGFGILFPIVVWSVVVSSLGTVLLQGLVCGRFFPEQRSTNLTITWSCALAYDCLIFGLTVFRSYKARRIYLRTQIRIPLLHMMFRDGAIYFAIICCVHLANIALSATRSTSMSALTRDISAMMVLRLMLNLHKQATDGLFQSSVSEPESISLSTQSAIVFGANPGAAGPGHGTQRDTLASYPHSEDSATVTGLTTYAAGSSTSRI